MGHQSLKQVTWLDSKTLKPKHSKPQPSQGCRNGFPLGGGRLSRTQATVTRLRWVCETHGHSKQINSGYKLFVIRQWRWCTFVGVDYASRSPWKTFGFETPVRSSRLQRFCFRFYMFHLRILSPTIVRPQLEDCLGNWWWQARVAPQKFPWLPEAARLYLSWYLEHIKRILTLFGVSPSSWQQRLRNDVIKGDISDLLGKAGFPDRVHVMLPHLPKFFSLFLILILPALMATGHGLHCGVSMHPLLAVEFYAGYAKWCQFTPAMGCHTQYTGNPGNGALASLPHAPTSWCVLFERFVMWKLDKTGH